MTKIIHQILHIFNLIIVALIILLTLVLSLLHLATPYLQDQKPQIESWASQYVHQPIKINQLKIGQYGLEPVIQFKDVLILNKDESKTIYKVDDLRIGIDLIGSLIKWKLVPGLLFVKGTELNFNEDKDGNIFINNNLLWSKETAETTETTPVTSKTPETPKKLATSKTSLSNAKSLPQTETVTLPTKVISTKQPNYDLFNWLFTQGRVILRNINVSWSTEGTEIFRSRGLNLSLVNDVFVRKLSGSGNLIINSAPKPVLFNLALSVKGNVLSKQPFSISGNLNLANLDLELNQETKTNEIYDAVKFLLPESGKINLIVNQSDFNAKNLFRQPLPISNLKSVVSWQPTESGWQIELKNVAGKNHDGVISGSGKFFIPNDNSSTMVDMFFNFAGNDVSRAPIYYPTGIMARSLIDWLDHAFPEGKGISGTILLQGPLDKFPFDHNEGHFLINSDIHDVNLHYFSNWPNIEHIFGKLIFENRSMKIQANAGLINGVPISHALVTIDNLADAVLKVDGAVNADSYDGLNFINSSPLKDTIGKYFAEMTLQGKMGLGLKLSIPLAPSSKDITHVFGDINLQNNLLQLPAWNIDLDNLNGDVHFDENSITAKNLHGALFNRPTDLTITTETSANKTSVTKVNFAGLMPISLLQDKTGMNVEKYAKGNLNYQAELRLSKINNEIDNKLIISSDLHGVSVAIPPIIKKSADASQNFKATLDFTDNKPFLLYLNYGKDVSSVFTLKKANKKFKFYSGEIHFGGGTASSQKEPGLLVSGKLNTVDWDEWKTYFQTKNTSNNSSALETQKPQDLIRKIDIFIGELKIFGQKLLDTKITYLPSGDKYLLSINNANIAGTLTIPENLESESVIGRFDKLYLDAEASKISKNKKSLKPRDIPSANITVNDFRYGNKSFGRLTVKAEAQNHQLSIEQLSVESPLINLNAKGNWTSVGGIQESNLKGKFYSKNLGETLKQWNLTSNLSDATTNADFDIKWLGPIFDPSLKVMYGNISLAVNKGRVINIGEHAETEVGFGTVLNLLSLQTLPRRLTLDFSDLVKSGYSFDSVTGNLTLRGGNATTSNVKLEGPVAQINLKGRIGLSAKDYDLVMTVFPHVTSSLPVIATIAGGPAGPALGAATWVAEKLVISNVVKGVAHYSYHITGPWQNPNAQKI